MSTSADVREALATITRRGKKPTRDYPAELAEQCRLHRLPETAREAGFHPARRWRFDLVFIPQRLAVEVDGGGWIAGRHSRGGGLEDDCEKFFEAAILGWTVVRVTPKQVKNGQAVEWIRRWLTQRIIQKP